jgi:DNA-binding GntR family transcriptional regulator
MTVHPKTPAVVTFTDESPFHQQLAELLLTKIGSGEIAVGQRLPTEHELSETYGVSRGTVRRSLGRLEQLGLISRRTGSGTTVVSSSPTADYHPFARTPADIAALAADTRLIRPEIVKVVMSTELAHALGTRPGVEWFVLQGLRTRRGRDEAPMCWSEHYGRGDQDPEAMLIRTVDLEELSRQRVEQSISASLMRPHIAAALHVEPFTPALVITRRHRDKRGTLVSAGIHTHPATYTIDTIV